MSDPDISIVFPVYNQADHIADVIAEYEEVFSRIQYDHEFILVVNGCKDNSLDVCNDLAARYPSVRVVYSERGGWGLAVKLGLQQARGNVLGYTNSARTTAANLMLLSLYAIANPQAVVKAHRRSRESLERKAGSFVYNLECRTLFDLPTWDINATPKVFTRNIYNAIDLSEDGDLIDLEFYVKCKELGTVILEVPIYSPVERHGGKSTTSYGSARRMYWGVFRLWRATRMARRRATHSGGR